MNSTAGAHVATEGATDELPALCPMCSGLLLKRCRICKLPKPRTEFHHNVTKLDQRATTCATCTATVNERQRLRRGQVNLPLRALKPRTAKRHKLTAAALPTSAHIVPV